jgi:hypothetical protein
MMLPPMDWQALTEDELDALEEAINAERKRREARSQATRPPGWGAIWRN